MAIDFPNSPSNSDIYTVNGKRWIYSNGKWSIYGSTAPDATASDTEPTGVGDGHIWYRSDQSQTLIRYDNTWVEVGSAGGFDSASTSFPSSLDSGTGFAAVEALQAKVGADSSAVTSSLDYLIDKQSVVPYDDASARTTAVPSPIEGQMSYLKDTNSVEVYDGSSWTALATQPGLTLIKKVTFSAVTSFSEDNVFTSDYDNYLILISGVSSSASDTQLRLRVGGVDSSGSNYPYQALNVTGTTVSGFAGSDTKFTVGSDGVTRFDHRAEIFGPAIADKTGWLSFGHRDATRVSLNSGYHNLSTAYDGFTILDNVGNITGTLWLYGYDKD